MKVKTFPHYLQLDSMDCGPSCLRMIAKYYGKSYTLQTLRERSFITREGVSMLGVSDAAESIGLKTMGVKITFDQLISDVQLPCILHWNQNHFVVCYKIKRSHDGNAKVYIADPASKKLVYEKEEFLKCWLSKKENLKDMGFALLLQPGVEFNEVDDEKSFNRHDLWFFAKYLLPYKKQIVQLFIGMILGSGLQMIFPFLTQSLVDVGIRDSNLSFITLILIAQLVIFISQLAVGFIRSWIMLHINTRVDISLISDFIMKLMKLPLHYFETKKTGDIMQRIGDHGRIKSFLMGSSINFFFRFLILLFLL